ncbi:hypothetical protein OIU81_37915 (plasmid) [Streptomyces sp. NBC_01454]|uniref:hypothetical protein n=2 Tax=unclassified Streptomyces TaxID=2593676 RepID=UPI002E3373F5|nr:hypothetical protein [Streptomyces sp. NBC_01454]
MRSAPALRSIAGQMLVLLVAVVLLLVAAGAAALVWQARHTSEEKVRERALAVAETFAQSPEPLAALRPSDPSASLQPRAEGVRHRTGVGFVVATSPTGLYAFGGDRNRSNH